MCSQFSHRCSKGINSTYQGVYTRLVQRLLLYHSCKLILASFTLLYSFTECVMLEINEPQRGSLNFPKPVAWKK